MRYGSFQDCTIDIFIEYFTFHPEIKLIILHQSLPDYGQGPTLFITGSLSQIKYVRKIQFRMNQSALARGKSK